MAPQAPPNVSATMSNNINNNNNNNKPPQPPVRTTTSPSQLNGKSPTSSTTKNSCHISSHLQDEWVEIVEPRSKTKIYANLESGICAKLPPEGAIVSKTNDFTDHWWELYDKKTGKFYYYNPEQQKTVWCKPEESTNNNNSNDVRPRRLLIIPVSKLQTFKKVIPGQGDSFDLNTVKCDASTQTNTCSLVSIATQTNDNTDEELNIQHNISINHNSNNDNNTDELQSFRPTTSRRHKEKDFKIAMTQVKLEDMKNQHLKSFRNGCREIEDGLQSIDFNDEDDDNECSSSNENSLKNNHGRVSNEGGKSITDQGSPVSVTQMSNLSFDGSQKSPTIGDTSSMINNSNVLKELMNDETDPSSHMSQQLDHRKLVENFKKSRQTSLLGTHYDMSKMYASRHGSNHSATQMLKNVAENYFNNHNHHHHDDKIAPIGSDRHLRQLSTLSTLPRPRKETKDKVALSKPEPGSSLVMDADYDVVEENCGYYSDSEQVQQTNQSRSKLGPPKSPTHEDVHFKNSNFDRNMSTRGSTFSVESFARENLSKHAKKGVGIFNRKAKLSKMISWTKSGIKHPMISSVGSDLSSDAICCFKLIQQYMGDREISMNKKYREIAQNLSFNDDENSHSNHSMLDTSTKSSSSSGSKSEKNLFKSSSISSSIASVNSKHNNSTHSSTTSSSNASRNVLDRIRDEIAHELVSKGCSKSGLRDEIFIQLARQLTDNPDQESMRLGLILMSILLSYFSPSSKFAPYILSFLDGHPHPMARDVCLVRLNRRLNQNYPTYCRKPTDGDELSIVRLSITKWPQYCGIFGESLERIMSLQTCSPYLKMLRLPWILTTLGQKLLDTDGAVTEGIFRCAADHDLIAQLRLEIDCVDFRKIGDAKQIKSLLSNVQDSHVIAGLLKLFFRQLTEPVFPTHLYELCLQSSQDGQKACRVFNDHLPNLNKDVAAYLIRLLQHLSKPEQVVHTKMDNSNLAMVWAPNLLRAPHREDASQGLGDSKWSISNWGLEDSSGANGACGQPGSNQPNIFEQTRQEMQFIRSLIIHLDTSFIDNIV